LLKFAIEYDGEKHSFERDLEKNDLFKSEGIQLIRVRVSSLPIINDPDVPIFIHQKHNDEQSLKVCILELLYFIKNSFPLSQKEIAAINNLQNLDIATDRPSIYEQYLSSIKEKSVCTNMELMKEWDFERNSGLNPQFISLWSGKKVFWQCQNEKSHRWGATVASRSAGNGCPYCSNYKVHPTNCLQNVNPILASQWHPTKNGSLTPKDVVYTSTQKVWWQCPNNHLHEWKASVYTRGIYSCPFCSNNKVNVTNCLATLNPELAKEWHFVKNGSLTPYDVTARSTHKVWWQCSKDESHEWESTIKDRMKPTGCPYCSNRRVCSKNSLATTNPSLAKQWHQFKNGVLSPYDVTEGSDKQVWWQCTKKNNHIWIASVYSRTKGNGCPYCSGKRVCPTNSLASVHPELIVEWHPIKNGKLSPDQLTRASSKKVWWKCSIDGSHEWEAQVRNRTTKGSGCPHCSKRGKS
jgi:hypothetical protein